MTVVSVPGSNGGVSSGSYTDVSNSVLAGLVSATLSRLAQTTTINSVSSSGGSAVPPPIPGDTNIVSVGGGSYSVSGYDYVVTGNQPTTVVGGHNLIGGNGNIVFTNDPGSVSTVLAGDGNDSFNLSGIYTVALGAGSDSLNLSGGGTVSLGSGTAVIQLTSGADTIFATPQSGPVLVTGGNAGLWFVAADENHLTVDTIVGGTGGSTFVGGNNTALTFSDSMSAGGLLVAGNGNETLSAANATGTVVLYGSRDPHANDVLIAGKGAGVFVAGSGNESLIGGLNVQTLPGGGSVLAPNQPTDVFFVINSQLRGLAPGNDFIYNAMGQDTLVLAGYDSLYSAAGAPVIHGAAAAFATAALASSTTVSLADGTKITFAGVGTNGIHITST